jgi:serine/threonine protein kinase
MPKKLTTSGKYSRTLFTRSGDLRNIRELDRWCLKDVLIEKYKLPINEAIMLNSFLLPLLRLDPDERCTAEQALKHPFLNTNDYTEYLEKEFEQPSNEQEDEQSDEQHSDNELELTNEELALYEQWKLEHHHIDEPNSEDSPYEHEHENENDDEHSCDDLDSPAITEHDQDEIKQLTDKILKL